MPQNHILLESIQLTQTASSVTFDNIPQTGYTDLKIVASTRSDVGSVEALFMSINGSTANLTYRFMDSGAGTPRSGTAKVDGIVNGTDYTASTFSSNEIYIPNYTSSNAKSFSVEYVTENNATAGYNGFTAGLWSQTAAITSLSFARATSGNLVAGSTFSLYGIAAFGTTPVTAPFATGGNIVENDGTYWIHTFLSSGTFTPFKALTCDYLVLAGGGSGGGAGTGHSGGGGGAGGYLTSIGGTTLTLNSNTSYPITVGAGGASKTTNGLGNAGSNSVFSSITSTGGGGGGIGNINGANGGSGGGGGSEGTGSLPGSASPVGQGNNGGLGYDGTVAFTVSGGGGGAGQVGGAATPRTLSANGGAGGNGLANLITGTSVTYAGGGGGGTDGSSPTYPGSGGVGGTGGGGSGGKADAIQATSGLVNTGGGGGGASKNSPSNYAIGAAGGSGIVIIRYPMNS